MANLTFTAEDKAFLRAIIDNPADTTARLVYADWLDDRSDPRGAYLRAEVALHSQPDADSARALREQLAGLKRDIDPFWLACFDRPRIEGCSNLFTFRCPRKWEQLRTTEDAEVRYCDGCERNVYYCGSVREAQKHAYRGECVAISLTVLRKPGDVIFDDPEEELMGDLDDFDNPAED
jgi:uncharacterized protein (TIGR02996 family)